MIILKLLNFFKDIIWSIIGLICDLFGVIEYFIYNIIENIMDLFRRDY